MNGNGWYPPPTNQQGRYRQNHSSPDASVGRVAADSVQEAHRLLAVYPFGSATPTTHVARHLGNLSLAAAPPSYMQTYTHPYNSQTVQYPQAQYSSVAEYTHELNHLSGYSVPANDGGYWERTRNEAMRYLGEQGSSYAYYDQTWSQQHPHTSTYQTTSFSQALFQHAAPSSAYPTPPPPTMLSTSSSLAHALDEPKKVSKPAKPVYRPEESKKFFSDFVAQTTAKLDATAQDNSVKSTPHRSPAYGKAPENSPDPLAFSSPQVPLRTETPRKRKDAPRLESPTVKRFQKVEVLVPSPASFKKFSTPSTSRLSTSNATTPTPKRRQPYVEVPPVRKLYLTPTAGHRAADMNGKAKPRADENDDLGGFGSEDDYPPTTQSSSGRSDGVPQSGRRATGERDDRAPLEKFTTILEDIFEAEDALPPDIDLHDIPTDFFSTLTVNPSQPQLHPNVIRRLTSHISKVARPTKRLRLSSRDGNVNGATPKARVARMAEVDQGSLSRILKILDRSVKSGEDVEPFGGPSAKPQSQSSSKKPNRSKKAAKAKDEGRRSKSKTPRPDEHASDDEESATGAEDQSGSTEITDDDLDKLCRTLNVARDSVLAADCCIALLGSDRLAKQLYSEELITACLNTAKNQLNKVIYPFIEASHDMHGQPALLHHVVRSSRGSPHRRQLAEIFQSISSVIPRINYLISADSMAMSESIIIQAVYIAIGPFFVIDEADGKGKKESAVLNTLGNSAMRGLRLEALSLIRTIFANHEDQRAWIIEEILSSLIKLSDTKQKAGQFRLRDGRSIRTVSALLMQLVQTSAHDVHIEARRLEKARQQVLALKRGDQANDQTGDGTLDERDMEEIRLYMSGLDSANKAAKTIILFLTQRSGKSKATKNTNEAEYRVIFDNLISDLLSVLFWPEWPAASLILSIVCKFMVSSLDDVKTSHSENNAIKQMALDHLGVIAARLRTSTLKYKEDEVLSQGRLRPLDEILSRASIKRLQRLTAAHADLASNLGKRSSEDQAFDSARELTAVMWGQELAFALQQCASMLSDSGEEEFDPQIDRTKLLPFVVKVKDALRSVWDDSASDVFESGNTPEEITRIDRMSEEIGTLQSFKNSFQPILNVVLQALDAPPVFMRTKALKALGQIVTSDPSILSMTNVRRAIEGHLLDSSPAVRDAAVELIGKYMIDSPEFAADYYQKIADRIADTGLGVRKRVIKLLKSFYPIADRSRRVDICTRIVLRMLDEDDTVKDLAVKTVEELWFPSSGSGAVSHKAKPTFSGTSVTHDKTELLSKVAVIMGVAGQFKDRQSPLEDMLHKIIADKEGSDATVVHGRYAEICGVLIDGLVDASDLPDFTVVNCIRTIHLFTSAYPAVLSGSNASTLLPYLKNPTTTEEQVTSDYLLRIFRASIPHMPKTMAKFGQEVQLALQPMILKPSTAAGVLGLQETVACICATVQNLTHDFSRLVALLRSCNVRLQQAVMRPAAQSMPATEQRTLTILLFIASLLCEHCDFDRLRLEQDSLGADIDGITKGSVVEHVYMSLLKLYQKYNDNGLRGRILQCLGFLFRAQPSLMTADGSAAIMDAIFASPAEEARGRLLKIMQDFLVSEALKHSAKEKATGKLKATADDVNMEELVGNTDGFADSGVSSAVVQRYLDPILKAALSSNAQIQAAAVDILSFTIKQGLAHPLQSFPVIVSLETSPNSVLSTRASALHAILHSKHTSLLNARFVVSARASFDYQKTLEQGQVQGYRMLPSATALLQRWYGLVREKRTTRQDFLKALVKVFDVELSKTTQDDVEFVRYMAENFAAFDYKTQEEVLTVLKYLTAVLSTSGMQLVELLSPSHLLAQLHAPTMPAPTGDAPGSQAIQTNTPAAPSDLILSNTPAMRSSVIVGMIMLLKTHLKALYGISEEKCSKYVIGKKSAVGDRPATRKHERPISWERLPFANAPLLTMEDAAVQRTRFLEVWNEDGLTAEPEDDMM